MDISEPSTLPSLQVLLEEPIVLGEPISLEIPEGEEGTNPDNPEFLETFRRNQSQVATVPNSSDPSSPLSLSASSGALVLVRSHPRRNLRQQEFVPIFIPNRTPFSSCRSRSPIPLPELVSRRRDSFESLPKRAKTEEKEEEEMGLFQGIWKCDCPVPGQKPLVICKECKRRECYEWSWDTEGMPASVAIFHNNDREVVFNPGFSVGTVAIKGNTPLRQGYHHYWEIEMSSDVYGTDMMIGVGTEKTDLRKYSHSFVSLIGLDENSWGLSYTGSTHYDGKVSHYARNFGQHTVVGVHLDMWTGTLEYYINRKPSGLAFSGLQGKTLYPMISSTAARSGMNLVFARSYPATLQLRTMLSLGKYMRLPDNVSLFKVLPDDVIPPGLKLWMKNNFWWITTCNRIENHKGIGKGKTEPNPDKKALSQNSSSPSHNLRRSRKTKMELESDEYFEINGYGSSIMTRSRSMAMASTSTPSSPSSSSSSSSRRTFGINPIFAPAPGSSSSASVTSTGDGPLPAKSPRVSRSPVEMNERQITTRSMTRGEIRENVVVDENAPGPSSSARPYNLRSSKKN